MIMNKRITGIFVVLVIELSPWLCSNLFSQTTGDPFTGMAAVTNRITVDEQSVLERFVHDNFLFRKEIYSQLSWSREAPGSSNVYSRQSAGFESYKKFSTKTATVAAFDLQFRLVRRDHFLPVVNDMEGEDRDGFFAEVHNVYFDFYNVLNPFMSDQARGSNVGRFNFRAGRFYVPFGLNLQTDTHGTLLQLSNDRNFGFERDWCAGFWGSLTPDIDYNISYLLGSGYDISFDGQDGLLSGRLSLGSRYLNEFGMEGGISFMSGERIFRHTTMRTLSSMQERDEHETVDTIRGGLDGRYSHIVPGGTMSVSTELSAGSDEQADIFSQLYQVDYLNRSRKWGVATQYRRFWQDSESDPADSSLFGEFTWYFRNDIGNTTLHWVKLNVEDQIEQQEGARDVIVSVQYYRYW